MRDQPLKTVYMFNRVNWQLSHQQHVLPYCRTTLSIIFLLMAMALFLDFIYQENKPAASVALIVKAIRCFSPYTNLKKIAKTTDTNASGQLGCLNGMRYGGK